MESPNRGLLEYSHLKQQRTPGKEKENWQNPIGASVHIYINPYNQTVYQPPVVEVAICAVWVCGCFLFLGVSVSVPTLRNEGDEADVNSQPFRNQTMEVI